MVTEQKRLTPERLAELRRIAEAASPGPWAVNPFKATVDEMPSMLPICGLLWPTDQRTEEQTLANATHIATFDPATVIAILDEIERLRREREVLAEVLQHVYTCDHCECALCPQGTELSYRAYRALGEAMDLLDGEKIVGNVTRFVLYDPDLNAWECQVCRFWWEFEDGDPYEHDMRFCPRCGRWIMREAQQKQEGGYNGGF